MLITDRLPAVIRARLGGRDTIRGIIDNSFWLFCDQIFRMAAGLVVGVWVARYLGPADFGTLSYAGAIVGLVTCLTTLSINTVVIREIINRPNDEVCLLRAASFLRSVGASIGFLVCLGFAYMRPFSAARDSTVIVITAAGMVFQVSDVIDLVLQARSSSRISAWVRIVACFGANVFKVILIKTGAGINYFAFAAVLEFALSATVWVFWARASGLYIHVWKAELSTVSEILRASWPLSVVGVATYVQAYADQLVLGTLLGSSELGQYSAALRVVSAFAFVPVVLQTVATPALARARLVDENTYQKRLHSLYRCMVWAFLLTAGPLLLIGPPALRHFFGSSYGTAAGLLPLLAMRLFFTNFGIARNIFIVLEGLFRFSLITAIIGGVINLTLNAILVPIVGIKGAIISSLISFAISTFVVDFFNKKTRNNLSLVARAMFFPLSTNK